MLFKHFLILDLFVQGRRNPRANGQIGPTKFSLIRNKQKPTKCSSFTTGPPKLCAFLLPLVTHLCAKICFDQIKKKKKSFEKESLTKDSCRLKILFFRIWSLKNLWDYWECFWWELFRYKNKPLTGVRRVQLMAIFSRKTLLWTLKVSKNRNDFMKTLFLPKYQRIFFKDFYPSLLEEVKLKK